MVMFGNRFLFLVMADNARFSPLSCPASPPIECLTPCIKCFAVLNNYEEFLAHMKTTHPLFARDKCNFWQSNQLIVRRHSFYCRHFEYIDENTLMPS